MGCCQSNLTLSDKSTICNENSSIECGKILINIDNNTENNDESDETIIQEKKEVKDERKYIWIDPAINNKENEFHYKYLTSTKKISIERFDNIDDGYKYLIKEENEFKEIVIIISGKLFNDLYYLIKKNIESINFSPSIIIFTSKKDLVINQLKMNNTYYNNDLFDTRLIFTNPSMIEDYIDDIMPEESDLTFDIIDNLDQLIVPNYYTYLLEDVNIPEINNFNDYLLKNFVNKGINPNEEINKLLKSGYTYNDIAIFYRTNAQSRVVEEGILKANLPYKVVGSYYFYSRKEIKNLICYLRLIVNPHDDVSLRRVINVPKRGIGEKYINDLEHNAAINNISMFDAINDSKGNVFKNIILKLQSDSQNMTISELIEKILTETKMKEELEKEQSLESELRLDNLNEFKSISASFEARTGSTNISDFLEEISLVADIEEHKVSDNAITLMTLHSAKGLEFRVVFLVGMEEGLYFNW